MTYSLDLCFLVQSYICKIYYYTDPGIAKQVNQTFYYVVQVAL